MPWPGLLTEQRSGASSDSTMSHCRDLLVTCCLSADDEARSLEMRLAGNAAFRAGQLQEALDCYWKAIALNPEDSSLFSYISLVYAKMGNSLQVSYHHRDWSPAWIDLHMCCPVTCTYCYYHDYAVLACLKALYSCTAALVLCGFNCCCCFCCRPCMLLRSR